MDDAIAIGGFGDLGEGGGLGGDGGSHICGVVSYCWCVYLRVTSVKSLQLLKDDGWRKRDAG